MENADRIAQGLEKKNARNADKVIVSYTHEDKILAGFQQEVKARDAMFRHEVAQAAQEGEQKEQAAQHYDNQEDPDDPHYKLLDSRRVQEARSKSPAQLLKEEMSRTVQSHIDQQVAEITGEGAAAKSMERSPQPVLKPAVKVHSAAKAVKPLAAKVQGSAVERAEQSALRKAQVAEARTENQAATARHAATEKPVVHNETAAVDEDSDEKDLPVNLQKFEVTAPGTLADYMRSPEYRRIRAAAERAGEKYDQEVAERQPPAAKVPLAPVHSAAQAVKPMTNADFLRMRAAAEHASEKYDLEVAKRQAVAARLAHKAGAAPEAAAVAPEAAVAPKVGDLDDYMKSAGYKHAEQEALKRAERGAAAAAAPKHLVAAAAGGKESRAAAERKELRDYMAGRAFEDKEKSALKVMKLAELHREMETPKFQKRAAAAAAK